VAFSPIFMSRNRRRNRNSIKVNHLGYMMERFHYAEQEWSCQDKKHQSIKQGSYEKNYYGFLNAII